MRPRVILNMAMSVDGKVSSALREPTTFTSSEDKRRLVGIRSRCDALVVGGTTAAVDYETMGISDPALRAARRRRGQREHPLRVIVSGHLNLPANLRLFRAPVAPLLIVCCEPAPQARQRLFSQKSHLLVCGRHEVDVNRLVRLLAEDYRASLILCEGGPTLNDAFFRARRVDELFLTICPRIVGGRAAPTLVEGLGFSRLRQTVNGRLVSHRAGKSDSFLHFRFRG